MIRSIVGLCYRRDSIKLYAGGQDITPIMIGMVTGKFGSSRGGEQAGIRVSCTLSVGFDDSGPSLPMESVILDAVKNRKSMVILTAIYIFDRGTQFILLSISGNLFRR